MVRGVGGVFNGILYRVAKTKGSIRGMGYC